MLSRTFLMLYSPLPSDASIPSVNSRMSSTRDSRRALSSYSISSMTPLFYDAKMHFSSAIIWQPKALIPLPYFCIQGSYLRGIKQY